LVNIEQSISTVADDVAASFSAEQQEALNNATDEVTVLTLPLTLYYCSFTACIPDQYMIAMYYLSSVICSPNMFTFAVKPRPRWRP